jgi:phosphoglycerol transferase MdoB-like AlkP superfamily enzyme
MYTKNIFGRLKLERFKLFLSIIIFIIISSSVTSFFLQYYQKLKSFKDTFQWISANPKNFILSTVFIFCIYMFIISLLGSLRISSVVCFIAFFVLAYSNEQKISKLGAPLYPVDFYHLKYVKSLFSVSGLQVSLLTAILAVQIIIIIIFFIKKIPNFYINIIQRVPLLIVTGFMIYSFINYDRNFMRKLVQKAGVATVLWNQPENYNNNGFVFGMLSNLQNNIMEKPDNYNRYTIMQIVDKYKKEAVAKNHSRSTNLPFKPNIVFFLDETFWDPTRLSNAVFSEDPMKNIREIMSHNPSGWLLSPTFGGDTANVEFEVITGLSMYNVNPGSIPYQQAIDRKNFMPSIVSMLKLEDYRAEAIHPFDRVFYKRDKVYTSLRFDNFISIAEIKYRDALGGHYISDQSVVNEVMDTLKKSEKPIFIHAVSMQNHFPVYEGKYGPNSITVTGIKNENTMELETYAEGIKKSDLAIKNLLDSISEFDEPTLVLFYGDHLPVLHNSIYDQCGLLEKGNLEKARILSETPLFVFANFNLPKTDISTISPAFLGLTIYNLLNKPLPPYYAMQETIKNALPGLKHSVLVDSRGNVKKELNEQELELLRDYKLIQYDLLIGNQYSIPELFSVP